MGRKFVAALMAAAALVPGVGMAQERGGGRGWGDRAQQQQRGDLGDWQRGNRPERAAPTGGGERQWQRGDRPGRGADRQAQGGAERTWQRSTTMQDRGPARQAPDGGERTWRRSTDQGAGGWTQRPQPAADRDARQERRADGDARWSGRTDPRGNVVTREIYSGDRQRDGLRGTRDGDRNWDRGSQSRDRRDDGQRRWSRSSADWNDHDRWDNRRQGWSSQSRWYDRGGRANWNRDWRRDQRYDWARWRATNRNAFRLPRYYAPYGWNQGYRRFSVGVILSSSLFGQNYWINDPYSYRLPDMGDDLRWVRYYNDALLVDLYSGEVVDVIHDMFW